MLTAAAAMASEIHSLLVLLDWHHHTKRKFTCWAGSKRDILLDFDNVNVKTKPPRHERTIKAMFKEASKQSSPVSFHLMQLFVYAEPIEAFKK